AADALPGPMAAASPSMALTLPAVPGIGPLIGGPITVLPGPVFTSPYTTVGPSASTAGLMPALDVPEFPSALMTAPSCLASALPLQSNKLVPRVATVRILFTGLPPRQTDVSVLR